jgi:Skp family chaperone for outer membrane proteins
MSRKWAVALVAVTFLSVGTLCGSFIAPRDVGAARSVEKSVPVKIAYLNIAKVLREFQKANSDGRKITARREEHIGRIKELREEQARLGQLLQTAKDNDKESIQLKMTEINRKVEDIDRKAQKELGEMSNQAVLGVYQNVRGIVADIAKERGLDVVEAFPDVSTDAEAANPAVAQLKLQTPALMPYYLNKDLDLTDEVIERLNEKFPQEKGKKEKAEKK